MVKLKPCWETHFTVRLFSNPREKILNLVKFDYVRISECNLSKKVHKVISVIYLVDWRNLYLFYNRETGQAVKLRKKKKKKVFMS